MIGGNDKTEKSCFRVLLLQIIAIAFGNKVAVAERESATLNKKIVCERSELFNLCTGDKTYRVLYKRQSRVVVQETTSHVCVPKTPKSAII